MREPDVFAGELGAVNGDSGDTAPGADQGEPSIEVPFEIEVYTAAELARLELPRPATELVGPFVRAGMITLLAGITGHGKTTLIAQAIKAAVDGGEFLGHEVDGGLRVLVLDLEQHLASIQRVINQAGLQDSDRVEYASLPAGLAIDKRADQYDAVNRLLARKPYDIAVIDPFYKLHEADSNDEREARSLVGTLRGWIADHGFAHLTATHCRKLSQGRNAISIDDLYGSSLFTRDPEVILGLQRHGDPSKLHVFKSREPGITAGQVIEVLYNAERGYFLKPTVDPEERERRLDEIGAAAAEWIAQNPGQSTNKVRKAVAAIAKCGSDLVEEALNAQVKSGLHPTPVKGSRNAKLWYPHNHAALTSPETLLGEVSEGDQTGLNETTSPDLPHLPVGERESAGEVVEAPTDDDEAGDGERDWSEF